MAWLSGLSITLVIKGWLFRLEFEPCQGPSVFSLSVRLNSHCFIQIGSRNGFESNSIVSKLFSQPKINLQRLNNVVKCWVEVL